MKSNLAGGTVVTIVGWMMTIALMLALCGQIGGVRADIKNLQGDIRKLRDDAREMRWAFISNIVP